MDEKKFDINALGVKSALIIAPVSLAIALFMNSYVLPDRGRIIAFSTAMSMISVYTANGMIKYAGAKAFLVVYIVLHIALVALPFTHNSDYGGPILLPFVIADYVAMVFLLRKCTLASMK